MFSVLLITGLCCYKKNSKNSPDSIFVHIQRVYHIIIDTYKIDEVKSFGINEENNIVLDMIKLSKCSCVLTFISGISFIIYEPKEKGHQEQKLKKKKKVVPIKFFSRVPTATHNSNKEQKGLFLVLFLWYFHY